MIDGTSLFSRSCALTMLSLRGRKALGRWLFRVSTSAKTNNACRAVTRALTTKCQYRIKSCFVGEGSDDEGVNNEKCSLVRVL